jgi:phosphoglycerate kinase
MQLRSIKDAGVKGMRVLVRTSLNVPISDGKVVDDFRLKEAAQTLQFLSARGARVVVLGHLGRVGDCLRPVAEALGHHLPEVHVQFVDLPREGFSTFEVPQDPKIITVIENVRTFKGEEENDPELARAFASLGDIFVNDAFADSHRAHASIVGIPEHIPSYAGLLVEREVLMLSEARTPQHPALAIIGGAKFETKEPLISRLLESYDRVCVGGALVNDFFKACGYNVGTSLTSSEGPTQELIDNQRLELPNDVVVESDGRARSTIPTDVKNNERIADAGPATGRRWATYITDASFVLLSGPLGIYEQGFNTETEHVARALADSKAKAVVGGGDTIAALSKQHFDSERVFLSTGGGAMLQFLADGTLVGLESLRA